MSARDEQIVAHLIDYIRTHRDPETGEVDARAFINHELAEHGNPEHAITKARWRHRNRIYSRKASPRWGDSHQGWVWGLIEDSNLLTPTLESSNSGQHQETDNLRLGVSA